MDEQEWSYGALLSLTQGHGTSLIYERIKALDTALAASRATSEAFRQDFNTVQATLATTQETLREIRAQQREDFTRAEHAELRVAGAVEILNEEGKTNILMHKICDSCGEMWMHHDPECLVGRLLGVLTPSPVAPSGGAA